MKMIVAYCYRLPGNVYSLFIHYLSRKTKKKTLKNKFLFFVCFFQSESTILIPEGTVIEEFHPAKINYLSSRCFSSLYILRKFDGFVIYSNNDQLKQIAQKDNLCLFSTSGIFLSSQKMSLHLFSFYKQFLLTLPQYTEYQQTIGKNNTLLNDIFFCFQFTCHFPS